MTQPLGLHDSHFGTGYTAVQAQANRRLVDRLTHLEAECQALRVVAEAARGVLNCADAGQDTVWEHQAGGGCLNLLEAALLAVYPTLATDA